MNKGYEFCSGSTEFGRWRIDIPVKQVVVLLYFCSFMRSDSINNYRRLEFSRIKNELERNMLAAPEFFTVMMVGTDMLIGYLLLVALYVIADVSIA